MCMVEYVRVEFLAWARKLSRTGEEVGKKWVIRSKKEGG